MIDIPHSNLSLRRTEGTPPTPSYDELGAMASVYADAFAGMPWNEYTQCASEGKFFGKETNPGDVCTSCGETELTEAYPESETREYITKELERPDSSLYLLRHEQEVVGFTWGFSYGSPEEFAIEKYRSPELQERIANVLGRHGVTSSFYYLSESAIRDSPELRGKGVSLIFHQVRLALASEKGMPAVQRTSSEGPMYRTSQKSGMTQISGPEVIVDTASRTFNRTGNYVNDEIDTEIEPRVLFVKHPESK